MELTYPVFYSYDKDTRIYTVKDNDKKEIARYTQEGDAIQLALFLNQYKPQHFEVKETPTPNPTSIDHKYIPSVKACNGLKPRKCLRCQETFKSTGKGNRICPSCSQKNNRESHINSYKPAVVTRNLPN